MKRLANLIDAGSAALLVVDQVEDLASMHRAQVTTVLGMLKALAARSGAAVVALTHNPAPNYPRAVTAMQRRLAQASVVFTTAVVGPGEKRFLVPLRPAMSDDAPAIPFVLPPADAFTVAWRKPVFPAHVKALAEPRPNDGAKVRTAQAFLHARPGRQFHVPPPPSSARQRHARHRQTHPPTRASGQRCHLHVRMSVPLSARLARVSGTGHSRKQAVMNRFATE